ncbi:MAG: PEP-CTERM sorting domain-containing protein [Planctomycetota bacterium]
MKIRINATLAVGAFAAALASTSHASLFMTTGQTGAQVQVDVNHTQSWTYTVPGHVNDILGGLFTMKRGSQTTASITFEVFEGTMADFPFASRLLSVTLGPEDFTQNWDWVPFTGKPFALTAGHTYTGVLWSNAPDNQSEAYFIKGGGEAQLFFSDENGNNEGEVPAPGAIALLGLAGAIGSRRRR